MVSLLDLAVVFTNNFADDVKPRARRTFTLIAKSLQTLSNMASFGTKEAWMEPMNAFLMQNRESFKTFIDDMCYVPVPLTPGDPMSPGASPTYGPGVLSADTHLSYTTPMTIMQRLPPTSREGFPSLPYLIDQARAFAELIQLWLEATTLLSNGTEAGGSARSHAEVVAAIQASEGDLTAFHEICTSLHKRTQECLNRAERAERPNSALSFRWEELIDQLQTTNVQSGDEELTAAQLAARELRAPALQGLPGDRSTIMPSIPPEGLKHEREWDVGAESQEDSDDHANMTRLYDPTPPQSSVQSTFEFGSTRDRPGSSGVMSSLRDSLRRAQAVQSRGSLNDSPGHSVSASASTSNVSSDTEASTSTTALPNYQRELMHRERREAAKAQIKQEVEAARMREGAKERDKERRRGVKTPIVSALRRKERREREGGGSAGSYGSAGSGGGGASTSYGS